MSDYYILEDKRVVPVADALTWGKWFEENYQSRHVMNTELKPSGHRVSTVFLGLDHRFGGDGPPLVFETMVFPKDNWGDLDMARYSTWEEAMDGHMDMIDKWEARLAEAAAPEKESKQ